MAFGKMAYLKGTMPQIFFEFEVSSLVLFVEDFVTRRWLSARVSATYIYFSHYIVHFLAGSHFVVKDFLTKDAFKGTCLKKLS